MAIRETVSAVGEAMTLSPLYESSFTPRTIAGRPVSCPVTAITLLAPACRWAEASSGVLTARVVSTAMSVPISSQSIFSVFSESVTRTALPLITRLPFSMGTSAADMPYDELFLNR